MSAAQSLLTTHEYLAFERASATKHEFHAGQMYAMAGASLEHNLIAGNIFGTLYGLLADSECIPFTHDLRVKVEATGNYYYPDVMVACGSLDCEDDRQDTLLNPKIIIEVLSPSTEAYDRGKKFEQYREIESLRDYLLVSQEDYQVDHFSRRADGRWELSDACGLDARIVLPSIHCELPLNRIYARVQITPPSPEELRRRALIGKPGWEELG